nr:homeodomain-interacting protein kinase 3-like [Nerophis lumbriciformis]
MVTVSQSPDYRVPGKDLTSSEEKAITQSCAQFDAYRYVNVLHSPTSSYEILDFLGEGTFGDVVKCLKTATREEVAVKIFKHIDAPDKFEKEVSTLQTLMAFDTDQVNLIQCKSIFVDRVYMCLEFEMLDINLWDFMNTRPTKCLLVKEIRPILHQLAIGLHFLNSIGLIHADLKPNNIMMVDHVNQPYKVKIIDFGLAQHVSETNQGRHFQNRRYRAPEIILGLPYAEAIDVWSLGCIIAELFLGSPLFYSTCEYDMLRKIEHILGLLPQRLLNIGLKTIYFYKKERVFHTFHWRLKRPNEYGYVACTDSFINSVDDLCEVRQVVHLSNEDTTAEVQDQKSFVDLLKQLLQPDAGQRLIPSQILKHPFITMADIAVSHAKSFYVKLSCEMMEVCQNQKISSEVQARPSTASDPKASLPAWQSHREHPDILGISSRITGGLNLEDLSSDTQMAVSHQPGCISLHQSTPNESRQHVAEEPQIEGEDPVQGQRDVSSQMAVRMSKAKSTSPDSIQSRIPDKDLQDGKTGQTIPNGDQTLNVEVEDPHVTTSLAKALAQSSSNCANNKREKEKENKPQGPQDHKRKRIKPTFRPIFSSQESPKKKRRKLNPE